MDVDRRAVGMAIEVCESGLWPDFQRRHWIDAGFFPILVVDALDYGELHMCICLYCV